MNLNHFLNAIVTALSVATVLITLMSFLIFKIRQFPKRGGEIDERLEGTYFRKYDPFKISAKAAAAIEPVKIEGVRRRNLTAVGFFGGISLAIFAALFAQNVLTETAAQKKIADEQAAHAAKLADFTKRGLLKEFKLNTTLPTPALTEFITPSQNEAFASDLTSLQAQHVLLVQESKSLLPFAPLHANSLLAWSSFLKEANVPFSVIGLDDIPEKVPSDTTLVIMPQMTALNREGRAHIQALTQRAIGLIATGPIGALDERGKPAPTDWSGRAFGVVFSLNPNAAKFYPSIFAADRAPFANVPPGFLSEWFPTDNGFQATAKNNSQTASFEADNQGQTILSSRGHAVARSNFMNNAGGARMSWLALEPMNLEKLPAADRFYAKSFLVSSLKWCGHQPVSTLAVWKNGAKSAFLASVDSEDKFDGALRLERLFAEKKTPATFFVVSNLLIKDPTLAKEAGEMMELSSHTTDHTILEGASLPLQFDKLQDSRLAIEGLTGRRVGGFRPPEERYDGATLNVTLQNQMDYFFGDQKLYRFAPLQITDGKLVYFPRSVFDDFNLVAQKYPTSEQMIQKMKSDFTRVSALGGAYFMSTHSQVFGQPEYQLMMGDFLTFVDSKAAWKANYAQMTKWWKGRAEVKTEITLGPDHKYQVKVENRGPESISDLALYLDASGATEWMAGDRKMKSTLDADHSLVNIEILNPQQTITLTSNEIQPRVESKIVSTAPAAVRGPASIKSQASPTPKALKTNKKSAQPSDKKLKKSKKLNS